MIATDWYVMGQLRWSKYGKLQQLWRRDTTEYRCYNGNPTPRKCDGYETEWRDVPIEGEKHGG